MLSFNIKVGASAQYLGAKRADENSFLAESGSNGGGRPEPRINHDPDEVGFGWPEFEREAGSLGHGFCQNGGVNMVFCESLDMVIERKQRGGSQNSCLSHTAA